MSSNLLATEHVFRIGFGLTVGETNKYVFAV